MIQMFSLRNRSVLGKTNFRGFMSLNSGEVQRRESD